MKQIIILFLFLTGTFLKAQTIHWITFIDTSDRNVGRIDSNTKEKLYGKFINIVNNALERKGYKSKIYDYYGSRVSPANCTALVNSLSFSSKDIVVFYYIGHGGRAALGSLYDAKNPWPQMCLGQFDQSKFVPMHWVHQTLKRKGAQLTVTIGMCCNSRSPRIIHKDEPAIDLMGKRNRLVNKDYAKRIQRWFLNYQGDVEVTSATATQTSGCYDFATWGIMDVFSGVICQLMDDYSTTPGTISWQSFLEDVKYYCNRLTDGDQTPFYKVNVVAK